MDKNEFAWDDLSKTEEIETKDLKETVQNTEETNQDDITLEEILDGITGMNEKGEPAAYLEAGLLQMVNEGIREKYHYQFYNARINLISFIGHYVMLEIDFIKQDIWIQKFEDMIREFHEIRDKTGYFMQIVAMNRELNSQYHVCFMNPLIWSRGYSKESGADTTIQLVFDVETANVVEHNFNIRTITDEVIREMEVENKYAEEEAAEKEILDEAALEDINSQTALADDMVHFHVRGDVKEPDKYFRTKDPE